MLDKLDQSLADIVQKLAGLSSQYGPAAEETLLATIRFHGVSTLAVGSVALFISLIFFVLAARVCLRCSYRVDDSSVFTIPLLCVSGGAMAIVSGVHLLDRWAWAAALDLRLYLAHEILEKIGGQQ